MIKNKRWRRNLQNMRSNRPYRRQMRLACQAIQGKQLPSSNFSSLPFLFSWQQLLINLFLFPTYKLLRNSAGSATKNLYMYNLKIPRQTTLSDYCPLSMLEVLYKRMQCFHFFHTSKNVYHSMRSLGLKSSENVKTKLSSAKFSHTFQNL